jgi:hypothetical protein
MNRPGSDADAQIEAGLRRIKGALDQNRNQYATMVEQIMADTGREVAERVTARLAEAHQRRLDRWERHDAARRARWQRHLERRRGAGGQDPAEASRGVVFVVVAVACLVLAVAQPEMWWLVFVALGLGMSGVQAFGRAARRRQAEREAPAEEDQESADAWAARSAAPAAQTAAKEPATEPQPPPPPEPADPRVARIQNLCDKLLAALESGPPVVREVVTQPQATIGGLRQACLEIARRERELRDALAAQDEAQLVGERDALATRVASEHDEIVRDRLGQALRALEQQLAHRAELATAASRLEAENTRILYTLENLHMQILRARSTDAGAPELGGRLRDSLRDLGTEIDAVAEALEWASAPGDGGKGVAAPEAGAAPAGTDASAADKERAERLEAARRAAQAREAQRR